MATTFDTPRAPSPQKITSVEDKSRQPRWQQVILLTVLGYEGAGALVGGCLLILAPDGRLMDMPVEIMHGVFNNFLVPGIILFLLGMLTIAAFVTVLRHMPSGWIVATVALAGLAIWFWVEIAILQELHWLHLMWGLPVIAGGLAAIPIMPTRVLLKTLLIGGILSSLLYVAINVLVAAQWKEYTIASQTVSELSAIGAPTRTLWTILITPYTLLILGFAWAIWKSAAENHRMRIAGGLLIAYGLLGLLWPFAPMHLRETLAAGGGTFTDTLHIALGVVTEVLYLLALAFAATALGKNFRLYSVATLLMVLVFGILTFRDAPGIARNEPTPFIGIWERINIGVFMLWVAVLAITYLRKQDSLTRHSQNLSTGTIQP